MVECEYVFKERAALERRSFNRYMVECECRCSNHQLSSCTVLIDTWWNVNNILNLRFQCIKVVLIDTWWNVNENTIVQEIDLSIVLIDTWWNVNVYRTKRSSSNFRFNRYMVECECGSIAISKSYSKPF